MKKFNKSLLAKQMWRLITNEESLATQVLRARYFPRGSPLDAQKAHRPSYTWSNIFSSKDLIDNGVVWRIGNGDSVCVWSDSWILNNDKAKFQLHSNKNFDPFLLVYDLIDHDRRRWDIQVINFVFPN